jgi:D-alanine--poly(phosphoribitol) ligase subunit 1
MIYGYEYNLGLRFQRIAEQYKDRTALWLNENDRTTYEELNRVSNRIARYMIGRGITARDVVCISGTKGLYSFACMIACLEIGAAYSVIDPDSPAERLRKILLTCKPIALFAEHDLITKIKQTIENHSIVFINTEELMTTFNSYEDMNVSVTCQITGSHPAYIMFTSGSTGIPKGAVMTHANVLNLIEWSKETYSISPDDILTNVNPLYFDNSVFDFYSALFNAACLVPFSKEEVRDPKIFLEKVDSARCTLWFSVPSLLIFLQTMRALNQDNMKYIKRFIFGGEGYPKAKLKLLYDLYNHRAELFNVYGPTECTCICSSYKITSNDFRDLQGFPPLGEIISNFSYLILDENNQKVPDNMIGELCLLGPNVGRGYYNDPTRTMSSFVQNPYNSQFTETMYKTGDLVRYNPEDGKLYITGRKDNQIKHMGYRIELEEIETALNTLDYVSQAIALHGNSYGLSRLIAVISLKANVDESVIRKDVQEIIPDYMIPTVYHFIDELPKNPNGKVDRKKLAETYK